MEKSAKSPIFYGWYVLFSAFLILFWVQGARTVIGVMFKPVIAELSLSRSALSLAAFINMAVFASTLTIIGTYYDRYGAKRVLIICSLFLALGYIGIARVHSIWSFIILYGILAALGFGGTSIPLFAALIGKWFSRYRGLAISMAIAGGCLGQFVLVPLASQFVTAFGWRISFAIIGAAILGVNLPLIHFLIHFLITAPITTTLVARLYGFTYVGVITGFITTVHHFSGGLWAWLGGVIYDGFGSYQLAFAISSLLALIASVCAMLIREEKHTLAPEGMR
jgi:MFS family permease